VLKLTASKTFRKLEWRALIEKEQVLQRFCASVLRGSLEHLTAGRSASVAYGAGSFAGRGKPTKALLKNLRIAAGGCRGQDLGGSSSSCSVTLMNEDLSTKNCPWCAAVQDIVVRWGFNDLGNARLYDTHGLRWCPNPLCGKPGERLGTRDCKSAAEICNRGIMAANGVDIYNYVDAKRTHNQATWNTPGRYIVQ
jgi:hypothetical protein